MYRLFSFLLLGDASGVGVVGVQPANFLGNKLKEEPIFLQPQPWTLFVFSFPLSLSLVWSLTRETWAKDCCEVGVCTKAETKLLTQDPDYGLRTGGKN